MAPKDEACIWALWATEAAILGDGTVVTWGDPLAGGNSENVQDQLRNVQHISATESAFAAILAGGGVVTWGDISAGGDSTVVQDRLRNVQQISGTERAFAAILEGGSVITWGTPEYGGSCTLVPIPSASFFGVWWLGFPLTHKLVTFRSGDLTTDSPGTSELQNVQEVHATGAAFAAILADASVVTWGNPRAGGDSSQIAHQLKDVQRIRATKFAFAAVTTDGDSVVTWCRWPFARWRCVFLFFVCHPLRLAQGTTPPMLSRRML